MKVYTARQAILNRRQQTVAYELFFRDGIENAFPRHVKPDVATSRLVLNQHLNIGFKNLCRNKMALINFSQQSLLDHVPALLPPKDIVIEVLEDVEPNDEIYAACRQLFHAGYRFALDDFVYHPDWERFLNFAKLIKFDIQRTSLDDVAALLPVLRMRKGVRFLAEKIETHEEFTQAKDLGFDFFQGYFFCVPEMVEHTDIEAQHHMILAIYLEVLKPNFSYSKLAMYFERDLSLSYKLLRFINSGLFEVREPIGSIKQALIYLGEEQARKFICLIATAHLGGNNKPLELIRMSILRARFCELLCAKVAPALTGMAFLCGLFSLVDALLGQPMDQVLERLPLEDEVKQALLSQPGTLCSVLALVKAYESGSWFWTQKHSNALKLEESILPDLYSQAVQWSEDFEANTSGK
ncbi:HDOD domain-containing protein [Bowmanella sp. Y26]|uniref:EAL and HDOD domain-containing protein n=1 Tax=Bowmanella yangjiangensis TaxID=2811230 RepID=UPI001BDCE5D0|nr:HDOD domain-containing protein [Bowmanella yangjiangensis]MBT1065181.1 HDOD domain-containing protein [Bowmanella yangjiangensis]